MTTTTDATTAPSGPNGPSGDAFVAPTIEEVRERLRMPMVDAMRTQRAVRRLHTDPVDLDLVYELLELSLKAPTSSNTQDWVYMVVTGREQKERLAKLYLPSSAPSTPSCDGAPRPTRSGGRWHRGAGRPSTSPTSPCSSSLATARG